MRRSAAVSTLRLIARAAYPFERWRMVGQSRPEQNGLYVSAPYVTGDGPRTWPGAPALSWSPWDLFGDVP